MKNMSADYIRGVSLKGYGASLAVGIGVPIPILDEDMARFTAVKDEEILAPVVDYSKNYGINAGRPLTYVSYAELRSGSIDIGGQNIKSAPLSSRFLARKIALELKDWIEKGTFELGQPTATLPGVESPIKFKMLKIR
jgi:uncharacterized protein (DUF39 family)